MNWEYKLFFIFIVIIVNKKLNPVRKTCLAFSFVAYIIFFKIQNKLSIGLEFIFSNSAPLTASKKKVGETKGIRFFFIVLPYYARANTRQSENIRRYGSKNITRGEKSYCRYWFTPIGKLFFQIRLTFTLNSLFKKRPWYLKKIINYMFVSNDFRKTCIHTCSYGEKLVDGQEIFPLEYDIAVGLHLWNLIQPCNTERNLAILNHHETSRCRWHPSDLVSIRSHP